MAVTDGLTNLANRKQLDAMLGDRYLRLKTYPLRPGVTLVLYARRDLAQE